MQIGCGNEGGDKKGASGLDTRREIDFGLECSVVEEGGRHHPPVQEHSDRIARKNVRNAKYIAIQMPPPVRGRPHWHPPPTFDRTSLMDEPLPSYNNKGIDKYYISLTP